MKIQQVVRDALVIGVAFLGLQVLQAIGLREALDQQSRLLSHRLGICVAGVLNQAHQAKDDLLLYRTVLALAQSPGILRACIIDSENKIIAHRDPSRLGQTINVSEDPSGVYLISLKEGDKPWGRLVLSISDHFSRKLIRRQWMRGIMAAALVWGLLFLYLQFLEKQASGLRSELEELKGLLEREKRRLNASEERAQLATLRAAASLQKAVLSVPEPVLILDPQQRLAAINPEAMSSLGIAKDHALIGKSWHEIPILESCGTGLERSLAFPGQSVLCPSKTGDVQLRFGTDADGLTGTWVTLVRREGLAILSK